MKSISHCIKLNQWNILIWFFFSFSLMIRTTTLNGLTIPKGTQVIPLIHAVHMDPTLWKDPEAFNPERFIGADGSIHKPDFFIPFGVGRRMCLGDVLAKAELFLFLSSLLHVFSLQVPEGHPMPSLKGRAGVTVSPEKFQVRSFIHSFIHSVAHSLTRSFIQYFIHSSIYTYLLPIFKSLFNQFNQPLSFSLFFFKLQVIFFDCTKKEKEEAQR